MCCRAFLVTSWYWQPPRSALVLKVCFQWQPFLNHCWFWSSIFIQETDMSLLLWTWLSLSLNIRTLRTVRPAEAHESSVEHRPVIVESDDSHCLKSPGICLTSLLHHGHWRDAVLAICPSQWLSQKTDLKFRSRRRIGAGNTLIPRQQSHAIDITTFGTCQSVKVLFSLSFDSCLRTSHVR